MQKHRARKNATNAVRRPKGGHLRARACKRSVQLAQGKLGPLGAFQRKAGIGVKRQAERCRPMSGLVRGLGRPAACSRMAGK